MAYAADIARLEKRSLRQLALDIEIEVLHVRRAEILAHAEGSEGRRGRRRAEDRHARLKDYITHRQRINRTVTARISMDTRRATIGQPCVGNKEIQRRHIVENAVAATDHRLAAALRCKREPEARSEIIEVLRIERIDVLAWCEEALSGNKVRDAVFGVMQHTVIGIAHTEVNTQLLRNLERVMHPPVERILIVITL